MNESITTKSLSSLTSADIASSLDSFSGELSEWINELIEGDDGLLEASVELEGSSKRPVDLTELDNRVVLLATKLEVTCQETSSQLERTIEDISRNVPRLNFDLQFMREGALALQRELNSVHHTATGGSNLSVGVIDETTMKALEQLRYLDAVKRGMEAARAVLQEAENWSTLEPEVTSLLKEGSYAKAASRLSEASKSMSVFQHTPEFESRRNLMTNLQNQTEAAVSSALVAAINVRDVASCKEFHDIFDKIEREGEFRNYYFGARRMGVLEVWSNAKLLDVQGESSGGSSGGGGGGISLKFCELLARFFADLSTLVNEERSIVPSVFSNTQDSTTILSLFIQSTLESLTPSLSQRISGMVAYHGPSALPELIKAFKMTEEFAVKVEKMMEKIALSRIGALELTSPPREEPSLGKGHSRHKSKRLSVSRRFPSQSRTTGGGLFDHTWQQALFEPFIDFQCEYVSLERRLLESALSTLHSSHRAYNLGEDSELKARMLREKAVDVFGMAEEALGRCMALTHGYGAVGCIQAVDQLFSQFFSAAKTDLLQSPQRNPRALYSPDTASVTQLEEELLSQAELVSFQLALNLLNTSRAFKDRLQLLDSKYRAEFTTIAQTLRTMILSTGDVHQSHGIARGEMELLMQSTLNSMELNTLLESLDPLPPITPYFGSSQMSGYGSTPPTPAAVSSNFTSRSEPQVAAQKVEPLLWGSFSALTEFARATQSFIQQLILSPLFQHLSSYSSLPVWSSIDQQNAKSKVYEFSIPTFSLSPTPSMQRVRDGLMALARTLLDYAGDDDALGFSLETLPFIDRDAGVKEYLDWVKQNSHFSSDRGPNSSPRAKRKSMSSPSFRRLSVSSTAIANAPPNSTPPMNKGPPTLSSDTIYSAWLTSIILTLVSHLTSNVLPLIQTLSTSGATQLACDLEDLSTVVASVLNAEWEDLEKWKECCKMSTEDGRKRWLMVQGVSAFTQGSQAQSPVDPGSIFKLVARMRGWTS